MKKIAYVLLLTTLGMRVVAEEVSTDSKLTDVTVYRSLAKETRIATVTLPKGVNEIVITNVSMNIQDQSLQVGVKGNATLLSATTRVNYFTENSTANSKLIAKLKDTIQSIDDDLAWIADEKVVYNGELTLLNNNTKLGSQQEGLKPAEIIALADIYRARSMEVKKKLGDLALKERDLREKREKYQGQLTELDGKKQNPVKELVLSFSSESGGTISLRCNYLVTGTGWAPLYDIRVENTSSPVNLDYKASIFQNTGLDWKDVKVTVSTGNPARDNSRPILNPRYIDYQNYVPVYSDYDQNAPQMMEKSMNMATSGAGDLGRAEDKYKEGNEAYNYGVNVNENAINVEFEIDIKQNIPSDGKEHIVGIQSYKVPATYKYHTVPKLDLGAFLLAKVTDYGQYNLLPGKANIFFEDMYVGQADINPVTSGDTLLLSLGRDDKVVIKRNKLTDLTNTKIFGHDKKETYAYEILVRNNKNVPIDIEVLDQVPISKNKEIEVKLEEYEGAQYTADYGKLLWNITVKPSETKKVKLVYSIKYPEDKVIQEY